MLEQDIAFGGLRCVLDYHHNTILPYTTQNITPEITTNWILLLSRIQYLIRGYIKEPLLVFLSYIWTRGVVVCPVSSSDRFLCRGLSPWSESFVLGGRVGRVATYIEV